EADRGRGAGRAQHLGPGARHRQGTGADRAQRRLFHREEALPQRRLLFRSDPQRDWLPDRDVHRPVRPGPNRRLGGAVERDDLRSRAEDRAAAAALRRRHSARLCAGGAPL
ncbi:MAG: Citrate synthase (si), partial [uncultured Sphingomonas sp.]